MRDMHIVHIPFFYAQTSPSPSEKVNDHLHANALHNQEYKNSICMYEKKIHKSLCRMGNTPLSLYLKMDFRSIS